MNLTKKQIEKRDSIIENMIECIMEGHDVKKATRNPKSREDAEQIMGWYLKTPIYVATINALAAALQK